MRRAIAIAALAWLFAAPEASADETFQDGKAAYQRDDFATALRIWRPLAEQGRADAENGMGILYYLGQGVTNDCKQALQWYERAIGHGSMKAEYNIGLIYENGCGVDPNTATALQHYLKAADAGYSEAQLAVGFGYFRGEDPYRRDYEKANDYLHRAAIQGNAEAQELFGNLYAFGFGVKTDYVIAYAWLTIASENAAEAIKSRIAKDMDSLVARSTPGQIAQARRIAARCQQSGYQTCSR